MRLLSFNELDKADLIVDAIYEGGKSGNAGDDPISKLLPGCGNMAGFRSAGKGKNKKFVVLYTTGEDKDWPDVLDLNTGEFIYYGDNKKPGHDIHDTPRKGNALLKTVFDLVHNDSSKKELIPPFFVFLKRPTKNSARSVQFKGLAVPGFHGMAATEDLIAVWKTSENQRFQNYRATFTILKTPKISRLWIEDILKGNVISENVPQEWKDWALKGIYKPLVSTPTTTIRSVESQLPQNNLQKEVLSEVFNFFKGSPIRFESFAANLYRLHDSRVIIDEVTRAVIDGGRDAVGRYSLGLKGDPVYVEFALEAKCYQPGLNGKKANTVGVKEISRLISRLRHRQFGVLVTTSIIGKQAYEEVREDAHPVIFICGKDIAEILISKGCNSKKLVKEYLNREFPLD